MKKCLTIVKKGVFNQNATNPTIYDLASSATGMPFKYFRLSMPRSEYLIQQGAKFVVESHLNRSKILNTGLRLSDNCRVFYGDLYDAASKSKSLITFEKIPNGNGFNVQLFSGYYPKNIRAFFIKSQP